MLQICTSYIFLLLCSTSKILQHFHFFSSYVLEAWVDINSEDHNSPALTPNTLWHYNSFSANIWGPKLHWRKEKRSTSFILRVIFWRVQWLLRNVVLVPRRCLLHSSSFLTRNLSRILWWFNSTNEMTI